MDVPCPFPPLTPLTRTSTSRCDPNADAKRADPCSGEEQGNKVVVRRKETWKHRVGVTRREKPGVCGTLGGNAKKSDKGKRIDRTKG